MTAVQWLVEQMKKCNMTVSVHNTSHQNVIDFYKAIEQAKEMEKQNLYNFYVQGGVDAIMEADRNVEQYYKETFKSE